jgi:hypothetical protein
VSVALDHDRVGSADYRDLLLPNTLQSHWQMMEWERMALTGVLARLRPRFALEIGVYYGGSLSLLSQFCEQVVAVDIDPEVTSRFIRPANVELRIGDSVRLLPGLLAELQAKEAPLDFVLLDADHSTEGVKRDLNILLGWRPTVPMVLLMHDSGNPGCRDGMLAADWEANPYVRHLDLDFVPGLIIEQMAMAGSPEMWGGLGMAYFTPEPRTEPLVVGRSAATTHRVLRRALETGGLTSFAD